MAGTPFCGAPPMPGSLAWTLHPLLLSVLGVLGLALAPRIFALGRSRGAVVLAGWLLLCAALVSPLCNLAVALFGARVAQHLLIVLGAAPLMAAAFAAPARPRPAVAAACFAALLWFWHLPRPYLATFDADGVAWWWMHVTLVASAIWLWAALRVGLERRPAEAVLAGLFTGLQMGALGALLTVAPWPLYAAHAPDVTLPWGFTPIEDQQLGGLLMWVPGGLLLVAILLGLIVASPGLRRVATAAFLLGAILPVAAHAQGNDSTTAGMTTGGAARGAAPVGVLTTSAVTTRSSGAREATPTVPEGADRRTRVLGPVCRGLSGPVLDDCRATSGM